MGKEQWCIAVAKSTAEEKRKELLAAGLLDRTLRPGHDRDNVLFPVVKSITGAVTAEFECLKPKEEMPRHELIGGIAIMQENDPKEARRLLSSRPSLHTVLHSESAVEGEYRTREFAVLAGEETTSTRYLEYGLRYEIDLSAAYFSARLANERQRIVSMMQNGETVLDMFAGVGPFAISTAKKADAVFAGDINPGAIHLMIKNIRLNKIKNIVPMLTDAGHLGTTFPEGFFDRIIMNLPMTSTAFIETAFSLCRDGGMIHFYTLQSETGEMLPVLKRYTCGEIREKMVRSYSPEQHHAVYDIMVKKRQPERL